MSNEERPEISCVTSGQELRRWYWTKDELAAAARQHRLRTGGAKFTILERIAHFIDTGTRKWPGDKPVKVTSKFDWHAADLGPDTIITDNYRNTQNVRRFFSTECGPNFKFSIAYMEWFKANIGKTLGDAVAEYQRQKTQATKADHKTAIKPHNQFNQYTRDFLADNPDLGMDDVRRVWAKKRARPSKDGRHVYAANDLML